jgi:hypothetical protein
MRCRRATKLWRPQIHCSEYYPLTRDAITCEDVMDSSGTGRRVTGSIVTFTEQITKQKNNQSQSKVICIPMNSIFMKLPSSHLMTSLPSFVVAVWILYALQLQEPKTHQSSSKLLRPSFCLPKPIVFDFQPKWRSDKMLFVYSFMRKNPSRLDSPRSHHGTE